jgi:hypothetical protein
MKEHQTLLFDAAEGRRLKERGMALAAEPESTRIWAFQATEELDSYPKGKQLSSDDIIGSIGLVRDVDTNQNNYVGPWFNEMARQGRIRKVGWIRSKRTSNHGKEIRLWEKIY